MNDKKVVTPPHNLATLVAAMGIKHVIRTVPGSSTANFVIAIVLPDDRDLQLYSMVARQILEEGDAYDDAGRYTILVDEAADIKKSSWETIVKFRFVQKAILFCNDESEISDDLGLIIDERVSLPKPTPVQFKTAAKKLALPITSEEAFFLASRSLQEIRLAIRPGRSVARVVRQLMARPKPSDDPALPARKPGEYRLQELAGYGEAQRWGLQLAADLSSWRRGEIEWEDVDRGVLLNGPPGCGKTTYADALANSCGVPLISASSARWQAEGHLGDMLKAMRKTFKEAFTQRPSILFVDEFDSFGDRGVATDKYNHDYKRQVVNGLLECLDPAGGREGVVVIGATNDASAIDPALLRPGRLEKIIDIPLPDAESRKAILRHHLRNAAVGDLGDFVRVSEGWSGADIEKLARDARRVARSADREVIDQDVLAVLPPQMAFTKEQRLRLAVHEAGHAIVGYALRPETLIQISISGGKAGVGWTRVGATTFRDTLPAMATAEHYSDTIAIFLAGVAAETAVFGSHSSGAGGDALADLGLATDIATMMERSFGFGDGWLADTGSGERPLEYLRLHDGDLRAAVKARLDTGYAKACEILEGKRTALSALATLLVERLELSAQEVGHIYAETEKLS